MSPFMDIQYDTIPGIEIHKSLMELAEGPVRQNRIELRHRFLMSHLTHKRAWRDERINIRKVDQFPHARLFPAHTVVALHLVHEG